MSFADFAPLIMNVAGTVLKAGGEKEAGREEETAARYRSSQMRVNAGQAQAASQVAAANESRKSKLLQSRALALAAASGGGATDPSVLRLISGLAGEGQLASLTRLYEGDEQARQMNDQANATDYEGQLKKRAYDTRAKGTILSGAKSLYDNIGGINWGGDGGGSSGFVSEGSSTGTVDVGGTTYRPTNIPGGY